MCVLVVSDERRPTEEELEKMAAVNRDGGGVAWREKSSPKLERPDLVKWEKGLDLDQMKELIAELPMPFVFHFRLSSCGGTSKDVTHPFPVEKEVSTALSGNTKGYVLFHNGHWSYWRDKGIDGAIRNKIRVPSGNWTDTRVMAWLAHLHGPHILDLIDEKVILFSPTKIEIFHPDGWSRVKNLLVSNRIWEHQFVPHSPAYDNTDYSYLNIHKGAVQICRSGNCKENVILNSFYCADHQPPCRELHCSKVRVGGTEHCASHQPLCIQRDCVEVSEVGEKFCLKHLSKLPEDRTKPLVQLIDGAGESKVVPFRGSAAVAREGPHRPANAATPDPCLPAVLTDVALQDESRWARSINGKPAHHHASHDEIDKALAKIFGDAPGTQHLM